MPWQPCLPEIVWIKVTGHCKSYPGWVWRESLGRFTGPRHGYRLTCCVVDGAMGAFCCARGSIGLCMVTFRPGGFCNWCPGGGLRSCAAGGLNIWRGSWACVSKLIVSDGPNVNLLAENQQNSRRYWIRQYLQSIISLHCWEYMQWYFRENAFPAPYQ